VTSRWPWAEQFGPAGTYLNTASLGLPPRPTIEALDAVQRDWFAGRTQPAEFDALIEAARAAYARLVHVDPAAVAVGSQVSPLVGLIAASLPQGSTVLVATGEFTSVTFPFAAQAHRGIRLIEAPLDELAERIGPDTSVVAVSAVQSADGARAPLAAIAAAAERHGAEVLVDLTQSAGWLDVDASRFAWTVAGAYKWLLSPRGTAFLTVRPDLLEAIVPAAAGWYAGADRWQSIYGLPLRLAADARRLDVSPGWHAWVGTAASLAFLERIGVAARQAHALEVAAAFADAAGLEPSGSAIRALTADDDVPGILRSADVVAAERAGRLRVSFHVNNTVEEARETGLLLRGHVH